MNDTNHIAGIILRQRGVNIYGLSEPVDVISQGRDAPALWRNTSRR